MITDELISLSQIMRKKHLFKKNNIVVRLHWLAIDGVQPSINENLANTTVFRIQNVSMNFNKKKSNRNYKRNEYNFSYGFTRNHALYVHGLTEAIVGLYAKSSMALDSNLEHDIEYEACLFRLRTDPTIYQLVPILISYVTKELKTLINNYQVLRNTFAICNALILNPKVDMEPFMHKILPLMLSVIFNADLKEQDLTFCNSFKKNQGYHHGLEVKEIAAKLIGDIITKYSKKPCNLMARLINTLAQRVKSASNCNLDVLYGSINGLEKIAGPKTIRQTLISYSLYRRMSRELKENYKSKKKTVKHYTTLCCLSVLAKAFSRLPECYELLKSRRCVKLNPNFFNSNKSKSYVYKTKTTKKSNHLNSIKNEIYGHSFFMSDMTWYQSESSVRTIVIKNLIPFRIQTFKEYNQMVPTTVPICFRRSYGSDIESENSLIHTYNILPGDKKSSVVTEYNKQNTPLLDRFINLLEDKIIPLLKNI
jgi:hypothetical protein